jgi:hypothetical protein
MEGVFELDKHIQVTELDDMIPDRGCKTSEY